MPIKCVGGNVHTIFYLYVQFQQWEKQIQFMCGDTPHSPSPLAAPHSTPDCCLRRSHSSTESTPLGNQLHIALVETHPQVKPSSQLVCRCIVLPMRRRGCVLCHRCVLPKMVEEKRVA
ncbi:uncharacterized protein DS421_10g298660 [Arachis hypogaea]|nr:uncharacterized protein DS421_10g298660 [Arachis hypogaea]